MKNKTRASLLRRLSIITLAAGEFLVSGGAARAASLNVYLSAPGEQSTFVTNASTETFYSLPLGRQTSPFTSAVGVYQFSQSAPFAVVAADSYGGANGSKYVSMGAQSSSSNPVTLNLNNPERYFGFWWSAGDPQNGLTFYYQNTKLTRFATSDLTTLLNGGAGNVTAVNGNTYAASSYYGNPNNGADKSEPFAYVNIIASSDTGFDRVVFDNSGSTGSGFETDNHSISPDAQTAPGTTVFVRSVPAVAVTITPEPSTIGMLLVVGFASRVLSYRRSRKNQAQALNVVR